MAEIIKDLRDSLGDFFGGSRMRKAVTSLVAAGAVFGGSKYLTTLDGADPVNWSEIRGEGPLFNYDIDTRTALAASDEELSSARDDLAAARETRDSVNTELTEANERLNGLNANYKSLEVSLKESLVEKGQLISDLEAAKETLDDYGTQVDDFATSLARAILLENSLEGIAGHMNLAVAAFAETNDALAAYNSGLADLGNEELMASLADSNSSLMRNLTGAEENLGDYMSGEEGGMPAYQSQLANFAVNQVGGDTLNSDLTQINGFLATATTHLIRSNELITAGYQSGQGNSGDTGVVDQDTGSETLDALSAAVRTNIDNIAEHLTAAQGAIADYATDIEGLATEERSFENSLATIQTYLEGVTGDLDAANAEIAGYETNVEELKEYFAAAKKTSAANLGMLHGAFNALQEHTAGIGAELEGEKADLADYKASRFDAIGELQDCLSLEEAGQEGCLYDVIGRAVFEYGGDSPKVFGRKNAGYCLYNDSETPEGFIGYLEDMDGSGNFLSDEEKRKVVESVSSATYAGSPDEGGLVFRQEGTTDGSYNLVCVPNTHSSDNPAYVSVNGQATEVLEQNAQ